MNRQETDSRRSFLKGLALAAATSVMPVTMTDAAEPREHLWTMVIDLNKCLGCQSCSIACKAESGASPGVFNTRVLVDDSAASGKITFLPTLCRHCDEPPCLPACPSSAIIKQADGLVVTDWNACTGDGACVAACPYAARTLDTARGGKADSCDFCLDRLAENRLPACVEACSSGARIFGDALHPGPELAAYVQNIGDASRKSGNSYPGRVIYVPLRQGGE